jgi:hypothetical protein
MNNNDNIRHSENNRRLFSEWRIFACLQNISMLVHLSQDRNIWCQFDFIFWILTHDFNGFNYLFPDPNRVYPPNTTGTDRGLPPLAPPL